MNKIYRLHRFLGVIVIPISGTKTYGPRSFRISGPASWNALPPHFKNMNLAYNTFKAQLKTHLFNSSAD